MEGMENGIREVLHDNGEDMKSRVVSLLELSKHSLIHSEYLVRRLNYFELV